MLNTNQNETTQTIQTRFEHSIIPPSYQTKNCEITKGFQTEFSHSIRAPLQDGGRARADGQSRQITHIHRLDLLNLCRLSELLISDANLSTRYGLLIRWPSDAIFFEVLLTLRGVKCLDSYRAYDMI